MRRLLQTALLLAGKDFRVFFRDRTGMLLGLALPIGLVTVFGFITQFAFRGGDMPRAELWVVDEDRSEASRLLVAELERSATLRLRPEGDEEAHDAYELMDDGEAHHVLVIAAGFGDRIGHGDVPELTLLRDPGRTMEDRLVRIGLSQAVTTVTRGRLIPVLLGQRLRDVGLPEDVVAEVVQAQEAGRVALENYLAQAAGEGDTAALDVQSVFSNLVPMTVVDRQPPERPRMLTYTLAQSVSGITVMMLMFGLVACGGTLILEREQGTLPRLLSAAMPRDAILVGKFLFAAAVGLFQLALLFCWGELLFDVGMFQRPATLLVVSVSVTAAVTGFGVLIAAWAKTTKQAEGVSTLLILVMSALGGAWFPVQLFDLPVYAEIITRSTLTWWAMSAYQQMLWDQASWTAPSVLQALAVLWAFALATSFLAWHLFRRRYTGG